jgi:hypothetical protein
VANDEQAVVCAVAAVKAELETRDLQGVFGAIPSPDSRLVLLDEVLNADSLIRQARAMVERLEQDHLMDWTDAQRLAEAFPKGYADPYLKKAQLTLMFVAAQWRAMGRTVRLDVTAAADYQLPKVLRAIGFVHYSEELAARVDNGELIEAGSEAELAIRAITILACDVLSRFFKVDIEVIDFWLWRQRNDAREARFHLTRTTNY